MTASEAQRWRDIAKQLCNSLESILYEDSDKPEQRKVTDRVLAAEVLHVAREAILTDAAISS